MRNSRPPPSCLIFHTNADLSGTYWAVPVAAYPNPRMVSGWRMLSERIEQTLNFGVSASSGAGTYISTLFAELLLLNCARTLTMYSTRLPRWLSMAASTQIKGLTGVDKRYDISSNSPSGGMNEIVRSFSNRERRTHWWNLTSSISMAFPLAAREVT